MSSDTRVASDPGLSDIDDYEMMLNRCETLIEEGTEKVENGRVYDEEKERVRISWLRATAKCIDVWRKLKETSDLQKFNYELEALKSERSE